MSHVDQTVGNSPNISVEETKPFSAVPIARPHLQEVLPTYTPPLTLPETGLLRHASFSSVNEITHDHRAPSNNLFGTPNTTNAPHHQTAIPTQPVRVACHRGDWRNYVENTLEAIESCIEMGADIVEVDVWRTKDGELVLMHDETLDRTTSGTGKVCDATLAEIRSLRMKDGLGNMTEFTVPTVEEALRLAKGRIMLNLDKADVYLDEVYALLIKTDTVNQTILKSSTSFTELRQKYGDLVDRVLFMPVFDITAKTTEEDIRACFAPHHDLYEINFEVEERDKLRLIKELAAESSAVLWVNTIWPTTCAGHSDDHALKNRESTWRYVVDVIGAGILQTDRPQMVLTYLKEIGKR
ncbi:glycerophosphoryl diester phosphodiesterase [Angomonas deanei]|nr:glycerophosphoryl diester phosphodiesterase [Angomonas deanei]|eukprot:EPY30598.1 glycerophosphoryl diester phosphodiesterase [Angomonas deanei]